MNAAWFSGRHFSHRPGGFAFRLHERGHGNRLRLAWACRWKHFIGCCPARHLVDDNTLSAIFQKSLSSGCGKASFPFPLECDSVLNQRSCLYRSRPPNRQYEIWLARRHRSPKACWRSAAASTLIKCRCTWLYGRSGAARRGNAFQTFEGRWRKRAGVFSLAGRFPTGLESISRGSTMLCMKARTVRRGSI